MFGGYEKAGSVAARMRCFIAVIDGDVVGCGGAILGAMSRPILERLGFTNVVWCDCLLDRLD